MPSLFETRRRLTTSATAYDVRATKPYGSRFLAGTMASTTFLFFCTTPLIAEQWHTASRATSTSADPGAGSSRLPEFTQPRCRKERPTTSEFPRRCIVRIDEHGSKDRAKDASRSACDGVPCLRPVPTRKWRRTTAFPSSATFGHPLSPARSVPAEEAADTDHEPTKASIPTTHREACRLPENRDAFRRHDTRRNCARRDCSLRPSRRLSRSRRPHFFPRWGECFVGHCKCHGAVTRDP
jgi:hypothetical protein